MWNLTSKFFGQIFFPPNPYRGAILIGGGTFVIQATLLLIAGFLDRNYFLPGDGLGLFSLWGIWGAVLCDWLIFLSIASVVMQLRKFPRRTPVKTELGRRYVRAVHHHLLESLLLRNKRRSLFLYMVLAGLMFWLNNAYQTRDPYRFYYNDLFDSINHTYSYYITRGVLFISWVLLLPYIGFICVCFSRVLHQTIGQLQKSDSLQYRFMHPDGCGGFAYFGALNLAFFSGILIIYLQLLLVLFTHNKLNPGLAGGFLVASIAFIFFSYFNIWPVHRFLAKERRRQSIRRYQKANRKNVDLKMIAEFLFAATSQFNPYTPLQRVGLFAAQIVPISAGGLRIYQQLGLSWF